MADHVYKSLEITGTSSKGSDDAIRTAIARASKSIRNIKWFQVLEVRGGIDGAKVAHWQVSIKIGFSLDK
jgi:flavin-binding protein dodecin